MDDYCDTCRTATWCDRFGRCLAEANAEDASDRAAFIAALSSQGDHCVVCRAVYPSGGMQAGTPWAMTIAGRKVCSRCVRVSRWARADEERQARDQATCQHEVEGLANTCRKCGFDFFRKG